jgi:hypothetical protein
MTPTDAPVATETASIAHVIPGRVRLRMGALRDEPDRAPAIEQQLAELPGIEQVRVNARTGSVVVEFDPELAGSLDVLALIADRLDITIAEEPPRHEAVLPARLTSTRAAERVRAVCRDTNARVAAATGGADLRVLVPGALFFLGIGALLGARRRRMPAWHELIWYAFNTFEMLNPPAPEEEDLTQP